jgi:chorismate mutase/GNAT superfamily N-acetyltransferase
MRPDVLLRPATEEDVDALVAVHLASRSAAPMPPPDESLAGHVATGTWLAETAAGEVLGYVRFTDSWVDDLYVVPTAQREGIGAALLDIVKVHIPQGFGLWVFDTNQPARAFYRAQGLVELEHTDGAGNGAHEPEVRMVWPGEEPLTCYRQLIDEIDLDLGDLLARRAALTRAVQLHKRHSLAVDDPGRDAAREADVVRRVANRVPLLGHDAVGRIMHVIITESIGASQ